MNLKIILILSLSHICADLTGAALPAIMPLFKESLQLSFTAVGTVIMVSHLTSSIIQPCSGYISDRIRMKWLLPVSFLLIMAGFVCVGLSSSYRILLFVVVVNGIGLAIYHPEGMKMMHFFTGPRMATGMSFFQVGGNLGLALGPLLISYAVEFAGLPGTLFFLIAGLPMLVVLFFYNRELSPPAKEEESISEATKKAQAAHSPGGGARWRAMSLLILAVSLRSWAHMGLITFVPFYYIQILKGDPVAAGKLVFVFLAGGVLGTLIGAIIADKMGHKYYFLLSMVLSTPLLFLFLTASGPWAPFLLFLIGFTLISSFSVTIVMGQRILPQWLGMASGIMTGLVIGIGGVGAGLLGLVADRWGVLTVLQLIAYMPAIGSIPIFMISYPSVK